MQLNAYAAVVSELEEDTLGEENAEAVPLAATNTPRQEGQGLGKRKRQREGGKVIRSKF